MSQLCKKIRFWLDSLRLCFSLSIIWTSSVTKAKHFSLWDLWWFLFNNWYNYIYPFNVYMILYWPWILFSTFWAKSFMYNQLTADSLCSRQWLWSCDHSATTSEFWDNKECTTRLSFTQFPSFIIILDWIQRSVHARQTFYH